MRWISSTSGAWITIASRDERRAMVSKVWMSLQRRLDQCQIAGSDQRSLAARATDGDHAIDALCGLVALGHPGQRALADRPGEIVARLARLGASFVQVVGHPLAVLVGQGHPSSL